MRRCVQVKDVHVVTFINICVVFFISGLTLNTDRLKDALTKRTITGTLFAFVSIIGLTPLLGFAMRHLPLHPRAFATGLTIFCVVPTTLGVGVSLVTSAKVRLARTRPFAVICGDVEIWIAVANEGHSPCDQRLEFPGDNQFGVPHHGTK
jgi:high-affinity Fe2+/Pb2+ permease